MTELSKKSASVHVIDGDEGAPPEPDWTLIYQDATDCINASAHWKQAVSALRDAGALEPGNGHAILRMVSFRLLFEASMLNCAEKGVRLPATKKREERANPHLGHMRQIDESIRQLEAELGLSPCAAVASVR